MQMKGRVALKLSRWLPSLRPRSKPRIVSLSSEHLDTRRNRRYLPALLDALFQRIFTNAMPVCVFQTLSQIAVHLFAHLPRHSFHSGIPRSPYAHPLEFLGRPRTRLSINIFPCVLHHLFTLTVEVYPSNRTVPRGQVVLSCMAPLLSCCTFRTRTLQLGDLT